MRTLDLRVCEAMLVDDFSMMVVAAKRNLDSIPSSTRVISRQYSLRNGLLFHGKQLYIPEGAIQTKLLERYHDAIVSGHQGSARTLAKIQKNYYWNGISISVKEFVRSCDSCQRFAEAFNKPVGLMHPLPVPEDRFREVSIDFASINEVDGFNQLMVVVDRLKASCVYTRQNNRFCRRLCSQVYQQLVFYRLWTS